MVKENVFVLLILILQDVEYLKSAFQLSSVERNVCGHILDDPNKMPTISEISGN
jgi:hypothetical protein